METRRRDGLPAPRRPFGDRDMPMTGSAMVDLGMGGALRDQVATETDEERKKRMQQMQQAQQLGPMGSLAVTSLFGATGGRKSAGY